MAEGISTPATPVTTSIVQLDEASKRPSRSLWGEAFRYIRRDKLTLLALSVLILLTLACIFAPPLLENGLHLNGNRTDVVNRYKPPGYKNNILGTDQLGRDQLVRLLYGGRVSLGVAYGASIMSISIGLVVGMLAGYYGGFVDDVISWFISTLSSIPSLFLLILVSVVFSPTAEVLIILLGLLGWVGTCRLVRGEILTLKERDFVVAARALGAPDARIFSQHLFPNIISLLIISLTIDAGTLILVESGLSYLGLGVRPPTPSWGNMLAESRKFLTTGTHLIIWPGIMIIIIVLCFFLVGDGLRDAVDPRKVR